MYFVFKVFGFDILFSKFRNLKPSNYVIGLVFRGSVGCGIISKLNGQTIKDGASKKV
jgi:hypothetical protein